MEGEESKEDEIRRLNQDLENFIVEQTAKAAEKRARESSDDQGFEKMMQVQILYTCSFEFT